jgi:hypothetical protein
MTEVGGVRMESERAGDARISRITYPAGYRWSTHLQPVVGGEHCMHAHVGYLVSGRMDIAYADGCTASFVAPCVVVVEPEHDAWVVGDGAAVFVQVDFESETAKRFGLPAGHSH